MRFFRLKIEWKKSFAVSLLLLLFLTYFLYGFVYIAALTIFPGFFWIIKKLSLFDKGENNSFLQTVILRIKNIKFRKNLTILIWSIILSMLIFHFNLISDTTVEKRSIKTFAGIIWDENNQPVDSVLVFLPEYNIIDTTTILGKFEFQIESEKEISINIIAKKKGYHTHDSDGTIKSQS
ncbi:MAG: hypothetical protein GY936_14560 [Ignavibacteriae bacterium]|nr:hypothetical protein [Ignavibacteriota bacterium]